MRTFSSMQDLWSYCLYCPICKEPSRTLSLTAGPDDEFKLTEFQKIGSELKLFCSFKHDRNYRRSRASSYSATFTIDCENSTYIVESAGVDAQIADKAKTAYFFFHIDAACTLCDKTYLNTADLELDFLTKKVCNIQMDRESAYLISEKDKYHISLSHDRKVIMVSRVILDTDGSIIDDDKMIELPLINLDFSDAPKVTNKIKTLILFS